MKEYKKVKFVENFRQVWTYANARDDGLTTERIEELYLHGEYSCSFNALEDRVSGNVGFVYHDSGNDYFEKEDDNWTIPSDCFEFLD